MTSASELFHTRRWRVGRSGPDLGLDSFPERNFHNRRHHHNSHHRHDSEGLDFPRRSPHTRHLPPRPSSSHSERASVRPDQGSSQFALSNSVTTEISSGTNRPSLNGNERLPGEVLLARARLLERLRSVSLSGNRRIGRVPSGSNRRDNIFSNELRLVESGDWSAETSTGWSSGGYPSDNAPSQTERLQLMQETKKNKPPGLSQEALDCLPLEVFSRCEVSIEEDASKASLDCSICLESFIDGDELISLPCQHKFHAACLDPWVRSCGDCPYCRRDIVVNSREPIERS